MNNYHTHTWRCRHAAGTDEDYVCMAIDEGFKKLGFSDHTCWNYRYAPFQQVRMELKDFSGYKRSIEELQKRFEGQIELLIGLEAEYFPDHMDWLLDFAVEQDLDYLIFGNHFLGDDDLNSIWSGEISKTQLSAYVDRCIEGMELGIFSYLCHPDLPMFSGRFEWDEEVEKEFERLCLAAKRLNIPLEYNGNGLLRNFEMNHEGYPHHKFWQLASRMNNKAIIGLDAHSPANLHRDLYEKCQSNLQELGIKIIDDLPLIDFQAIKAKRAG